MRSIEGPVGTASTLSQRERETHPQSVMTQSGQGRNVVIQRN